MNISTFINQFFKEGEDVYATRWEKNGKSDYVPAYIFDRYMFKLHRMKGGTFQSYNDKKFLRNNILSISPQANPPSDFNRFFILYMAVSFSKNRLFAIFRNLLVIKSYFYRPQPGSISF